MNFQRRDVLKLGGATLASGAATSLAGCSSVFGGSGSFGYESWLVDPEIVGNETYGFTVRNITDIVDNEDEFLREDFQSFADRIESNQYGLFVEDYDSVLNGQNYSVVTADYDEDEVISELRTADYQRGSEYEGYQIYNSANDNAAVAVGSDEIVRGTQGNQGAEAMAKFAIDTEAGDERRYQDVDRDIEALVDELSSASIVIGFNHERYTETNIERGEFAYQEATGYSIDISGEESDVMYYLVFRDEGDIVLRDVEDWVDESVEDVKDPDVSASGNVVTVEGTMDTVEIGI